VWLTLNCRKYPGYRVCRWLSELELLGKLSSGRVQGFENIPPGELRPKFGDVHGQAAA